MFNQNKQTDRPVSTGSTRSVGCAMRHLTGIQEVTGSILGSGTIFRRDLVMK